jgi:hypothetical protein
MTARLAQVGSSAKALTLAVQRQIDLANGAVSTEYLAQVALVDVLGKLFYDDLQGSKMNIHGAKERRPTHL